MRLLLIRHGQTSSNIEGLLDTALPGPGLTDLGREQAEALVATVADEAVDAVYASATTRARQTAAPLAAARGLTPVVREGIRELSAGVYEMRGDREAVRGYLDTIFAWTDGRTDVRMPGGESGAEALARFDAVVAEAAASGADAVAMVSHGAAIRMWTAVRAENLDAEFGATHFLGNTGLVVLEGTPESGWKVLSWCGAVIGD